MASEVPVTMLPWASLLVVLVPLIAVALVRVTRARNRLPAARGALDGPRAGGPDGSRPLHPVIDPTRCLGCSTCVEACPEQGALLVIDGQVHLVDAAQCLGHGRCKEACPTDAIEFIPRDRCTPCPTGPRDSFHAAVGRKRTA